MCSTVCVFVCASVSNNLCEYAVCCIKYQGALAVCCPFMHLAGFFSRQPGRILVDSSGFFSKSCQAAGGTGPARFIRPHFTATLNFLRKVPKRRNFSMCHSVFNFSHAKKERYEYRKMMT